MKKIQIIKTHYTHWGKYTAFNSFLKYFDQNRFKITLRNVPIGDNQFIPPVNFLKNFYLKKIRENGVQEYKLNDLAAEVSVFLKSIFKEFHLIHFLDAEHSLMFLPSWFRKYQRLKTFPKIIATFHQPPSIINSLINIDIIKLVDCILVVSPVQVEYFSQYLPRDRIKTIMVGVDTQHYKPLPNKKGEKKFKKFRCLGGGIWLRDYEAIYKTAKILGAFSEIEFHLVVSRQEFCRNNSHNLENIFFHENIPDQGLLDLYQTCDILFLPMKDATANTFLLEGGACGLPIISSDLPSIRSYFPGEEAILVKDNDAEIYAKLIIDLYRNPEKLSHMSERVRKRILDLSWNKICKEYERMYMEL